VLRDKHPVMFWVGDSPTRSATSGSSATPSRRFPPSSLGTARTHR